MKRKGIAALFLCFLLWTVITDARAAEGEIILRTENACQVTLYPVATPEGQDYRMMQEYGGGKITFDDTLSGELAAWLAKKAQGGLTEKTDNGILRFPDLQEGLYLIVQTEAEANCSPFEPFLISIPWDGSQWQVEITPLPEEVPQTGDAIFRHLIIMLLSAATAAAFGRKCCSDWFDIGRKPE